MISVLHVFYKFNLVENFTGSSVSKQSKFTKLEAVEQLAFFTRREINLNKNLKHYFTRKFLIKKEKKKEEKIEFITKNLMFFN